MSDRPFTLDTNILVYALDRRAGERHTTAGRVIELALQVNCLLTLQAVSEFYAAVTRRRLVGSSDARDQALDWLSMFPSIAASASGIRAALAAAVSGQASYRDALLVHTAAEAGCTAILTEDLADGTSLAGVRIVNPFAGSGLSPTAEVLLKPE